MGRAEGRFWIAWKTGRPPTAIQAALRARFVEQYHRRPDCPAPAVSATPFDSARAGGVPRSGRPLIRFFLGRRAPAPRILSTDPAVDRPDERPTTCSQNRQGLSIVAGGQRPWRALAVIGPSTVAGGSPWPRLASPPCAIRRP